MDLESLTAISPLDGRYRPKLTTLAGFVSEYALQRYRVRIELAWFLHLATLPIR
jgi:adenylosuccinate lyase